jgi:hypothetical protein
MGVLIGVAVGWVVGARSGPGSLNSIRSTVSGLAASGDISKVLSGAMAGAIPMAGSLLKSGRGALEGIAGLRNS